MSARSLSHLDALAELSDLVVDEPLKFFYDLSAPPARRWRMAPILGLRLVEEHVESSVGGSGFSPEEIATKVHADLMRLSATHDVLAPGGKRVYWHGAGWAIANPPRGRR